MPGRSVLLSVALVATFGLLWAAVEFLGPFASLPGEEVVWIRYGTHLTVLVLLCGWRYRGALIKTGHPYIQFLRSLLMFGMPLFFLMALARMAEGTAMTVFWIAPVILLACDREARSRPMNWIVILVAFAGVVLLLSPQMLPSVRVIIFPIGMALCFAAYIGITRWLRTELEVTNLFYTAFWVFLAMTFEMPRVWRTPSREGLIVGVLIGIAGVAGLYAVDLAVRKNPAGTIGSAFYLQPVFASLLGLPALHGHLARHSIAGLAIVTAAVTIQTAASAKAVATA
jgi:drug/metabolite transporter (DMT)-like permease